MKNVALIFAGGKGTRMKLADKPKQFLEVDGKCILCYTIDHFQNHDEIDAIIVVTVADWLDYTKQLMQEYDKVVAVVVGGATALASQWIGLQEAQKYLQDENGIVLIHDGVRPLIHAQTISDCIAAVKMHGNAITVAPAIETIIRINEQGDVLETVDRNFCKLARAPQAFYLEDIVKAHHRAMENNEHTFIDSATMMQAYGYTLHAVEGPAENIKVTTNTDYYICQAMLSMKKE
jgi:2-C-methyl-D-erythritol 4-phosphate cytidylyltransferase